MYKTLAFSIVALILTSQSALARKCTFKGIVNSDSEMFYVGPIDCKSTRCLTKITSESMTSHPHSTKFKLIYVPKRADKKYESAAVIQTEFRDIDGRDPNKLDISRSRINFTCNVRGYRGELAKKGVSFNLFERWHATGKPRKTKLAKWFRKKFHFKYDIDGTCVATGKKGIRERFKFGNRDDMARAIDRLQATFGSRPRFTGTAQASGPAARKLHVEGYATRSAANVIKTCISHSFITPKKGKKMSISLDDLFRFKPKKAFLFSTTLRKFTIRGE